MAPSLDPAGAVSGLRKPAYFIAFLLVFISAFDYAGTVWPAQLAEVSWRYGSVGLLSGFLLTPMLGLLLAMWIATQLGHRGTLRILAILSLLSGILGLVLLVGFALDSVQIRQSAPADTKALTVISAIKAGIKLVTGALALIWLGIAGIGLSSGRSPRPGKDSSRPADSRVVG